MDAPDGDEVEVRTAFQIDVLSSDQVLSDHLVQLDDGMALGRLQDHEPLLVTVRETLVLARIGEREKKKSIDILEPPFEKWAIEMHHMVRCDCNRFCHRIS